LTDSSIGPSFASCVSFVQLKLPCANPRAPATTGPIAAIFVALMFRPPLDVRFSA
jgi:hypothetical protein